MEDDVLKEDDGPVEEEVEDAESLDHEVADKKKKELLDEETDSLDDLAEEEESDEEEPFDDINPI